MVVIRYKTRQVDLGGQSPWRTLPASANTDASSVCHGGIFPLTLPVPLSLGIIMVLRILPEP